MVIFRKSAQAAAVATFVTLTTVGCGDTWKCHYDVTYDYNWDNDVVCSKGFGTVRPSPPAYGSTPEAYEDMLNATGD